MSKASIQKKWSFDAAHQLPNHTGKCGNLHGHTYTVIIGLHGEVKEANGDSDEGMVLDYYLLGKYWKDSLEPLLDHKYLNDTLPIAPTTAENIAGWVLTLVVEEFGDLVDFVTVQETPNTAATVYHQRRTV